MNYQQCLEKLETYGQSHILQHYDQLNEEERIYLLQQIKETDFEILERSKRQKAAKEEMPIIEPLVAMGVEEIKEKEEHFLALGVEVLKKKKVAAILLAGGMGTRLGADRAKGMYNLGITKEVYIFECLINNMLDVVKITGEYIPLFIMTSDKNHEDTLSFLAEKNYFGYSKDDIYFFKQDMAPATDFEGKVYMEEAWKISTSPNGNGGWYTSLKNTSLMEKVEEIGIEWFNVFSVDNVLQRIGDPYFIGATIDGNYDVGSKIVKKVRVEEKVGMMCTKNGKPSIIEYYEATPQMLEQRNEKGELAYNAGVLLNYLFRKDRLDEVASRELPLHIVEKKIPCLNEQGEQYLPQEPNGFKYEELVFDLLNCMNHCLAYEVVREKEFAPVKNKEGADSVDTARELLVKNGVQL